LLFLVAAAEHRLDQRLMELPVVVVVLTRTVAKQVLQQLLAGVELILQAVLVRREIQIAQHHPLFLAMVHIYKVEHHVIKLTQKVAAVAAEVTTVEVAVHIKPLVVDQKMAAAAAVRGT
jgi:hypothetical protein